MGKDTIGSRIAMKRKESGLTQEEMAKKMGMSRSGLAQIETDVTAPSLEFLTKFVKQTNTSYSFLIEGGADYAYPNGPPSVEETSSTYIHVSKLGDDPYVKSLLQTISNKDEIIRLQSENSTAFTKTIKLLEEKIENLTKQKS